MTKQTIVLGDVAMIPCPPVKGKSVHVYDVGYLPERNYRPQNDYGSEPEKEKLAENIASFGGWDPQHNAVACVATKEEQTQLVDALKIRHAELKKEAAASDGDKAIYANAQLAYFEETYLDADGKFRVPRYIGVTGNRRNSVFVRAGAKHKLIKGDDSVHMRDTITLIMADLPGNRLPPDLWLEVQMRENTKGVDNKEPGILATARAVYDMVVKFGKSQSEVRNTLGLASLGVAMYFIAICSQFCRGMAAAHPRDKAKWERANVYERFMEPKFLDSQGKPTDKDTGTTNPRWLDIRKFNQFSWQGREDKKNPEFSNKPVGLMCEVDSKFKRANDLRAKKNEDLLVRPTADWLLDWEGYINTTGGGSAVPVMKKGQYEALERQHAGMAIIQLFAKAGAQGDPKILDPILERAESHNAISRSTPKLGEALDSFLGNLSIIDEDDALAFLAKHQKDLDKLVAKAEKARETEAAEASEEVEETVQV